MLVATHDSLRHGAICIMPVEYGNAQDLWSSKAYPLCYTDTKEPIEAEPKWGEKQLQGSTTTHLKERHKVSSTDQATWRP